MAAFAMRACALPLMALIMISVPAAAGDTYIGFGDSITRGSGDPVAPEVVFDCTNTCNSTSSPMNCGYAPRLAVEFLGSRVVINEGVGGETTSQGVSRIQQVLNSRCASKPGDCLAVILMEGTNDLNGGIGIEDTRANISEMITRIEGWNVDVLLLSIIRRVFQPDNSHWSAHHDVVLDLGNARNVPTADPYAVLCADGDCYNTNYWLPDKPPCFDPVGDGTLGHLDPDGYDVLVSLIAAAIPAATPAAPASSSPAGDITDRTPTYTWPRDSNARWYHFQVDGGGTEESWHKADSICASNLCSVTPTQPLAVGSHEWRVRGRNLRGVGTWSSPLAYDVRDVRLTTAKHNGNFGGYQAMNAWIQSHGCAGYHVCDYSEISAWLQREGTAVFTENSWINSPGVYGATGNVGDCRGWNPISGDVGTIVARSAGKTFPGRHYCDRTFRVACCK